MTSRRALLTGAVTTGVFVAAGATGWLDNVIRAVGIRPRQRPRSADVSLAAAVLDDQQRLLRIAQGSEDAEDAVALLSEQVTQLGGEPDRRALDGELTEELRTAADHRAADAQAAVSAQLVTVLATMAAGLDQLVTSREPGA